MIENKIKQGGLEPFCLPKGPKGEKGDRGDRGPQGFNGELGPAGKPGKDGVSPTVNVKGTNTVAYTENASVLNDGIPPHVWLTFNIPQGRPGLQGERGPVGPKGDPGICNCKHHSYLGQWSNTKTYPLLFNTSKVSVSHNGDIYESLSDNNTGNTPTTSPTKWLKIF